MPRNSNPTRRRRAMTSENARRVRAEGHKAEQEFATLIGGTIYSSGRKKDVVDKRGDVHSVKSGEKKWQIFLYSKNRLQQEIDFDGANLLLHCLDSFPNARASYLSNKNRYKNSLKIPMRAMKDFLVEERNKLKFLKKSILNNGEVDYLTIKDGHVFRIFDGNEAVRVIDATTEVVNSKARVRGQLDDQKVVFKIRESGLTIGEIEMRNDSDVHYKEIKFWMDREKTLNLLKRKVGTERNKYGGVVAHGDAIRRFRVL